MNKIIESKKPYVSQMFSEISGEYDKLNRILSFCLDIRWRRKVSSKLILSKLVLDFCAGTGEMAITLLSRHSFKGKVILCDFNEDMLKVAKAKLKRSGFLERACIVLCDVERLPFKNNISDGAMMGFSLRHMEDLDLFFNETKRVLRKNKKAVFLDVAHPEVKLIKRIYFLYYDKIFPKLSRIFSKGHAHVYSYLPNSLKLFFKQKDLLNMLKKMGFSEVAYQNVFFGTGAIYTLIK
ncbi:MAG: ubiquinone/menaquinone biosynthesis methyltransferase [candidate division Zixibacteria bacterium]|nr:ubiquinone/menaquinone biosynthesis methyltransferase [candidate division Zixibacteria bacterium]